MILAAHKISKVILDVSYTFSFFALFPPYGQSYESLFFFCQTNLFKVFCTCHLTKSRHSEIQVTCENKIWRQDVQTIINCPHEEFMPLSNRASSKYKPVFLTHTHTATTTTTKKKDEKKTRFLKNGTGKNKQKIIFTIQYGKRNNRRGNVWTIRVDRKRLNIPFCCLLL